MNISPPPPPPPPPIIDIPAPLTMLQQNYQKFLRRLTRDGEGPDL
jgi:hypothetical protein